MKKTLSFLAAALCSISINAQTIEKPVILDGMYILDISPNGKYAASEAGGVTVYDIFSGKEYYNEGEIGLGNAVSNNGVAVGTKLNIASVFIGEDSFTPSAFLPYYMSSINGITSDGKKITGYISNPDAEINGGDVTIGDYVPFIPFVAELDDNGQVVGELTILPYPTKDFMGFRPMYVLANFISDDGKTVLGQMTDSFGRFHDPIVFTQSEDGEWSYALPTKAFFNPNNVELPDYPWDDAPDAPNYEQFMTSEQWEEYQADLWDYLLGGIDEQPEPEDYMTNAQVTDYNNAVEAYLEFEEKYKEIYKEFDKAYREILFSTPKFSFNDLALSRDGKYFCCVEAVDDDNLDYGSFHSRFYLFSLTGNEADAATDGYSCEIYNASYLSLIPQQIMSDGTLLVASGKMAITTSSYLVFPDSDGTFMSVKDYFHASHPNYAEWMGREIPNGNGVVSISEDWSTFISALQPEHYAKLNENSYYSSIIFSDNSIYLGEPGEENGIESLLAQPVDNVYKVYNLQGLNVMTTENASELQSLPSGMYVVNGKKIFIK